LAGKAFGKRLKGMTETLCPPTARGGDTTEKKEKASQSKTARDKHLLYLSRFDSGVWGGRDKERWLCKKLGYIEKKEKLPPDP